MPGARLLVPELSVKPTEELTEVILLRRAAADDLAVNHCGSRRDGSGAREDLPHGTLGKGGESQREGADGQQVLPVTPVN